MKWLIVDALIEARLMSFWMSEHVSSVQLFHKNKPLVLKAKRFNTGVLKSTNLLALKMELPFNYKKKLPFNYKKKLGVKSCNTYFLKNSFTRK